MTLTGLIAWCIFGLIVGGIARFFMPGIQSMGCFTTILLGIAGSFVGGVISSFLFRGAADQTINPAGWIMSIIGALIVLYAVGQINKK